MKSILEKLHSDHINFSELLRFLEHQQHLLEECKLSDLAAMHDAVRYMKEYPDFVHHPLEDIVFRYFMENYGQQHKSIEGLLHEHEGMPALTERLLETLQNAQAGLPQDREELCELLEKYISVQRKHMDEEEAHVYPVLNSSLSPTDWQEIDHDLARVEDPLFGEKVKQSYASLFQQVMNH